MWTWLASVLVLASLVGCAPTAEQREKERVKHHDQLVESLRARGTPRSSWTIAELDQYASDLAELESYDEDGVNSIAIRERRDLVASLRAEKRKEAAAADPTDLLERYKQALEKFEKSYASKAPSAKTDLLRLRALNDEALASSALTPEVKRPFEQARKSLRALYDELDPD